MTREELAVGRSLMAHALSPHHDFNTWLHLHAEELLSAAEDALRLREAMEKIAGGRFVWLRDVEAAARAALAPKEEK